MKSTIQTALKRAFSPEFLNRIDDVIIFNSLQREHIHKIIDITLGKVFARINALGYNVELTDKAKDFLSDKGYDQQFGARPLNRAIQKYLEDPVDDRLLDLLLPPPPAPAKQPPESGETESGVFVVSSSGAVAKAEPGTAEARREQSREKLRKLLKDGNLDERMVDIEVQAQNFPAFDAMSQMPPGGESQDVNWGEWLQEMLPKRKKRRTVRVPEARRILLEEELRRMVDMDDVVNEALDRTENHGIIFIDEIDKVAGEKAQSGPDISREGVQRDLLPIVEGSTVQTRYGYVRTDHVLFVAAGAFHVSKPSDLIPELQGRFPIRVELTPLTEADFVRIMTEPENALTKQYQALVAAEEAQLEFTEDGIRELARVAALANERMENIGARRLHTVMSTLMEEVLFELPNYPEKRIVMDAARVRERLAAVVNDDDLRKYIL
jgi:ATP-dependent HslUV protease ATP-binding subunit HslU